MTAPIVPSPAELAITERRWLRTVAVVITYDRALLLRRCLISLHAQSRQPDAIIVVDDASPGLATAAAIATFPGVRHVRHATNCGGAAAYCTGVEVALADGADLVWMMDDDALPADEDCLERLVALAEAGAGLAAPLVLDHEDPERLAFPIRLAGRTRFLAKDLDGATSIEGFAHLFNGALIRAETFGAIGLPDPRFISRGDEVEFLLRALRAGIVVRIDIGTRFLHPSARPEIHPILLGRFYATVPLTATKRRVQFRNRGYIFRTYGMWHYLTADIIRYGCHYLARRRPDLLGFAHWLAATAEGWVGGFMRTPAPQRSHTVLDTSADRGERRDPAWSLGEVAGSGRAGSHAVHDWRRLG
jgi:rhamnopyranosyl-N-acetylglucosaminyl-diphospho-decaprenol beta-1,3/1,4-galactofuranosyltransferase